MNKHLKTLLLIIITSLLLYVGLLCLNNMVIKPMKQSIVIADYEEVLANVHEFQTYKFTPEGLTHVSIEYSYTFLGKDYRSSQININNKLVLKDKYSINVFSEIYDEYKNGRVIAFVDPENPSFSILHRDIQSGALAAGWMGFSISWIVAFYLGLWVKNRLQTQKETAKLKLGIASFESNEPEILGLVAKIFLLSGIVLVPSLTLSVISTFGIGVLIVVAISFVFPFAGWFIYKYSQKVKAGFDEIGETRLHLKPEEGMNQGDIAGYFDLNLEPLGEYIFTLRCAHLKKIHNSASKGDSKVTNLLNVVQVGLNDKRSGSGGRIMFLFSGFKGLPASGQINNDESIVWTIECEGRVRSLKTGREFDFKRSWRVPVVEGTKESLIRHWYADLPEQKALDGFST